MEEDISSLHDIRRRLDSAAASLDKLMIGKPLEEKEEINLYRTSDLISKAYWDSCNHYDTFNTESEAVGVRLEFYKTVLAFNKKTETGLQPHHKEIVDQFCLLLKKGGYGKLPSLNVIFAAKQFLSQWSEEIRQKEDDYYFCHPKPKIV